MDSRTVDTDKRAAKQAMRKTAKKSEPRKRKRGIEAYLEAHPH